MKELPARGGVAKEGVTVAANFLTKNGFVTVDPDKPKTVRLTDAGKRAQKEYRAGLARIEKSWTKTFGAATARTLRDSLEALDLAQGIDPKPGMWRTVKPYAEQTEAFRRDPRASLPHHPMILHRGGFPDGS